MTMWCEYLVSIVLIAAWIQSINGQAEICGAILENCEVDRFKMGNKNMIMFHKEETWHDALKKCHKIGMQLSTPSTLEHTKNLRIYLNSRIYGDKPFNDWIHWYLWISANDEDEDGTFRWATTKEKLTYTSWGVSEPNGGTRENCVELRWVTQDGVVWNDAECGLKKKYICEVEDFGLTLDK